MLTEIQAYRLAIESMEKEIQTLAVPANLHDLYKLDWPDNINASQRREKLRAAVDLLTAKISAGTTKGEGQ